MKRTLKIINISFFYLIVNLFQGQAQENVFTYETKFLKSDSLSFKEDLKLFRDNSFNPAYLQNNRYYQPQAILSTSIDYQKSKEYYSPNIGNKYKVNDIEGLWLTFINSKSSFLGVARVSKGIQDNIEWSTSPINKEYGPYQIVNQKQGNYKFQEYYISGTYSLSSSFINWGINLEYKGDYAYKQTDPRARDISSWFSAHNGFIFTINPQHELGISGKYQIHRQTIELDVWKGNIKQQFFLLRGFGMYDHDHKDYVFSKRRIYKQNLYNFNISGLLWKKNKINVELLFEYAHRNLKTEEESTINLHELSVEEWTTKLKFIYSLNKHWIIDASISNNFNQFLGKENRYSYIRVNENYPDVYDYVKIGSIKPYKLDDNLIGINANLSYFSIQNIKYQVGATYRKSKYDEKYKGTNFNSLIVKSIPGILFSLNYKFKRHSFESNFSFEKEKSTKGVANVDYNYQSLYKEVYFPNLLYQSIDKKYYQIGLNYVYLLQNRDGIGLNFVFYKESGDYSKLNLDTKNIEVNNFGYSFKLYYKFR